jgi:hypothetical protein
MTRETPTGKLPRLEQQLEDLNEWISWLDDWINSPPGYKTEGPLQSTKGIRRLRDFLNGVAYDWPAIHRRP